MSASFPYTLIPIPTAPEPLDDDRNTVQQLMAKLHNIILRGMNSIWLNALAVEANPKDQQPFISYCLLWWEFVHYHHEHEEQIAFPYIVELDPDGVGKAMQGNVEQHKIFEAGLNKFQAYLVECQHGESPYSGDRIRKLLEAFADELVGHLRAEIPTLAPENLQHLPREGFANMIKRIDAEVQKENKLTTSATWFMLHHDMSTNQQVVWPKIPAPAVFLVQNVFYFVHSSWWRFAPVNRKFKPQTYQAA